MRRKANRKTSSKSYDQNPAAITPVEYGGLQAAYDHFNKELFDGRLPDVFITYQRHANSRGYFSADRFANRSSGETGRSEIALNPDAFIDRTDEQICSSLVHEMHHVEEHQTGTASARGYHNKKWAARMKANGLQPSSTGMVGGKETGQRMSHYIIPNGRFAKAYAKLAKSNWKLNLQSAYQPGLNGRPNNSKTKFTCGECGQNAWGKPDLQITCTPCGTCMMPGAVVGSYDQAA